MSTGLCDTVVHTHRLSHGYYTVSANRSTIHIKYTQFLVTTFNKSRDLQYSFFVLDIIILDYLISRVEITITIIDPCCLCKYLPKL